MTACNAAGIAVSVPLALGAARAVEDGGGTAAGVFGVLAFLVSVGWALGFHRRLIAPGQTRNGALQRLNQAAMTAPYPAYLGVAVALITGSGTAAAPFVFVAVVAVGMAYRTGRNIIEAQLSRGSG